MQIGINCFEDVEIRSIIASGGRVGNCDVTGQRDVLIYDTLDQNSNADLAVLLSEVLDVYTPESELPSDFPPMCLAYIEDILFSDWSIFNIPVQKIKQVVIEVCKSIYEEDSLVFKERVGLESLCDSDFLRQNCIMKESSWERFMSSIKNSNRFHSNHINLELLQKLFDSPSLQLLISKKSVIYYRARISEEKAYSKNEMGPPPYRLASAGRANSQGISCLYLASDIMTTFHEIRARDLDYVSVGEFVPNKELKLVDLSNLHKISPFSAGTFGCEWFAINMNILKKISDEIAKPLRRQDSELDYLPAQYISDFIKSLGYDGICYRSTLNIQGLNYAIFNSEKFDCINVKLYHITSLLYCTDPSFA